MKSKLEKAIGDGNIVIPLYILKYFKKFNLTMDEFVFLMYLYNKQDKIDFNPEKIADDLNIDIMEVMGYISVLTDKGYLTLDVIKDNDIINEIINLSLFYEKIGMFLMEKEDNHDSESILKYIEKELGRTLNSLEIETVEGWIENNINEELIKEAIRIAIESGVNSLKYIDRILFDFKSRGITNINDLKQENISDKDNEIINNPELDDWNWLDDEDEYIVN